MNNDDTIIVAGGGIGGLALALTCHQIGLPVVVLEAVSELRPLGVGINLQPNAVRELQALGLGDELSNIGVATRGWSLYSRHGGLIWNEPRGVDAGYRWPQYSVHRGKLQMMLFDAAVDRLGPDAVRTSSRVLGYSNSEIGTETNNEIGDGPGVEVEVENGDGTRTTMTGSVLIGADGIHSAVRAQMHPEEGEPLWSGHLMWRATTQAPPFLDGATMVLCGHDSTKFVAYPISEPDPETGNATINWLAEQRFDLSDGYNKEDYSRQANVEDFIDVYNGWSFSWLEDVGGLETLVNGAERIYEYPMVDRDPLPHWTDGAVTLMGDAAHVMYPVGSNGASQAVVDARKLGRSFLDHGVTSEALAAYEEEMRPATSDMVLRNRNAGPDYIMQIVEDRCGGVFDDISEVMSHDELADYAAGYKKTAGFAITELNASPDLIPPSTRAASTRAASKTAEPKP